MTSPVIAPPDRAPLTARLLQELAAAGKPVGDGVLPTAPTAGWIGQPLTAGSEYEPFVVLSAITADRSFGPIGDTQENWMMPYLLENFGISRAQCDWMAAKARAQMALVVGYGFVVAGVTYTVGAIRFDSIGAANRIDQVDPPFWHSQDGITAYLMKGTA